MSRRFILCVACVAILLFSAILFIRYCNGDTEEAPPFVFTADEIAHLAKLVGAADPPVTPGKKDETWIGCAANGFAGGSGTQEDPYRIATAEQLAYLAKTVNAGNPYKDCHFEQTQDIDISEHEWVPIGVGSDVYFNHSRGRQGSEPPHFMGHFNGRNKTIHGLNIKQFWGYSGFFSVIYEGSFKNMKLTGVNIENGFCTGGIAGTAFSGTSVRVGQDSPIKITDCMVEGTVAGFWCVGGMVGFLLGYDELSGCIVSADIKVTYDRERKYKMSYADYAPEDRDQLFAQLSPLFGAPPPNPGMFVTTAGGMVAWLESERTGEGSFAVKDCTAKVVFLGDVSALGASVGFTDHLNVTFTNIRTEMDIEDVKSPEHLRIFSF